MADITASMVKELREKTSAGMMDCKKALNETNGDMDAAVDWLRTKGLASAAKKAGRAAAEGLVAVAGEGTTAAVIELNAETDFVSRNEQFQSVVAGTAALALQANGDVDALKTMDLNGSEVQQTITSLIASIGENMNLRRTATLSVDSGSVATYIHNALAPNMGKIAVLVGLESTGDKAALDALGKQIAMHVAATNPQSLSVDDLDPAIVERERAVLVDQAVASGKPQEIAEKMVEGRMRKFYEEVVLLKQSFIMDTDRTVEAVIADTAKEIGTDVKMTGYVRFALGEGVEKKEDNFAEEVAKMAS